VTSEKARRFLRSLPEAESQLAARVPGATPEALDLLGKMLRFDPRQRITVPEALAHPFLASL
ncbi:unnamed protein product, partial [Heterosigma akashiwo]